MPDLARALDALNHNLPGRVGIPDTPLWAAARRVFAPIGRTRRPLAAVRPANREDVAKIMAWATEHHVPVSPRSGGHSFDGFSVQNAAVLMDLRDLHDVAFTKDGHMHAMPGATNIDVANVIGSGDRAVPLGDCPTVGLGGLIGGGGFGNCSRLLGLTCDNLVAATLVLPDGSLVKVSAVENPDLFWACRGGGGSVGVITDLTFQTRHVPNMTSIELTWRWNEVRAAFALYADCMEKAPHELDLKLKIRTTGFGRFMDTASGGPEDAEPGIPLVHIDGDFIGHRRDALDAVQPMLNHRGLVKTDIRERSFHDAEVALVPLGILNDPAPETMRPMRIASDFISAYPRGDEVEAFIRFIDILQSEPALAGGAVLFEPTDGEIAKPDQAALAFAQRDAALLVQYEMFHDLPLDADTRARHDDLLGQVRTALARRLTGGRYLNYADCLDTPDHWWRGNRARLQDIVRTVNPDGVLVSRLTPPAAPEGSN